MKKKTEKPKWKGLRVLFLFLFIAIFTFLYSFSNKMLIDLGVATYSGALSSASYYAIDKCLSDADFSKIINIEKNSAGDVSMVTTDAYKFNLISNDLAKYVAEYFSFDEMKYVNVPVGVFTGIKLLSGVGPKVKMPIITVNSVKCDIVSVFSDAGVNQTKHSLYINVTPDVYIVTRFSTKHVSDKITVLIYENLIVGKVPEVYLTSEVFSATRSV